MFKRTFDALGIEYLVAVTSEAYDAGESEKDQKALDQVEHMANLINTELI